MNDLSLQTIVTILGILISLGTLLGMLPSVLAMRSILKDYQKKPLKTDGDISGGFIQTALNANELTQEVQKQLKIYIDENRELKEKVEELEEANRLKDIEISSLKKRISELEEIVRIRKKPRA